MGKRNLHMIEELLERYFEGETSACLLYTSDAADEL